MADLAVQSAKYWIHRHGEPPMAPSGGTPSLVRKAYLDIFRQHRESSASNWSGHINNMWNTFGLSEVWSNQGTKYKHKISRLLWNNIANSYEGQWLADMNRVDSKLRAYNLFVQRTICWEQWMLDSADILPNLE